MAVLTVQKVTLAGLERTLAAAAGGGDSWRNTGNEMFVVSNGSGGAVTVTFDAPRPDNFGIIDAAHDAVVSVGAGAVAFIGRFPPERFNDSTQQVQVTYSGVTSVTVGVVAV